MAAEPAEMGSAGESAATAAALKQALNKFEAFRKSTPELGAAYPVPFVDLGDTIMCDRTVWKRFAQYITYDYVIAEGNQNSGKHLSLDVLVSTLRKLIHKAKAQHETKSVANRQFFTCVDQYSSSDDAKWLSGLVHNMRRKSWERSLANGDPIDQSVTPLDEQVFVEVCAALLEEGSPESMHRRLALVAAWMNAGRASETSWLALESLEWDN